MSIKMKLIQSEGAFDSTARDAINTNFATLGEGVGIVRGTPSGPQAKAKEGEVKYDDQYLYIAYGNNKWARIPYSTAVWATQLPSLPEEEETPARKKK